jgi:Predicted metal-dependent membrane protease
MKKLTDLSSDRFGLKAIFHSAMGVVILIISSLLTMTIFELLYFVTKSETIPLAGLLNPMLNILILIFLIYLYITKILKLPIRDFRISKPRNIGIWILCAIALPVLVSAFFIFLTPGRFTIVSFSSAEVKQRAIEAVFHICLVAGITEELIFRGFIMHLLEIRWNKYVAIIVPSVLFGVLHIVNMAEPSIVDISMLLIAGTSVGVMFSMIAYQSKSIWSSAVVHGIWNLIIIGGILEINAEPSRVLLSYTLESKSTLLTGGAFGIESSVPAIIGYIMVTLLAWYLYRRNHTRAES